METHAVCQNGDKTTVAQMNLTYVRGGSGALSHDLLVIGHRMTSWVLSKDRGVLIALRGEVNESGMPREIASRMFQADMSEFDAQKLEHKSVLAFRDSTQELAM